MVEKKIWVNIIENIFKKKKFIITLLLSFIVIDNNKIYTKMAEED